MISANITVAKNRTSDVRVSFKLLERFLRDLVTLEHCIPSMTPAQRQELLDTVNDHRDTIIAEVTAVVQAINATEPIEEEV